MSFLRTSSAHLQVIWEYQVHRGRAFYGYDRYVQDDGLRISRVGLHCDLHDLLDPGLLQDAFLCIEPHEVSRFLIVRPADQLMQPRAIPGMAQSPEFALSRQEALHDGLAQVLTARDRLY